MAVRFSALVILDSKCGLGIDIQDHVEALIPDLGAVYTLAPGAGPIPALAEDSIRVPEADSIPAPAVDFTLGLVEGCIPAPAVDYTPDPEVGYIRDREADSITGQVVDCIVDPTIPDI